MLIGFPVTKFFDGCTVGTDAGGGTLLACSAMSGFAAGAWDSAVTNCGGIETALAVAAPRVGAVEAGLGTSSCALLRTSEYGSDEYNGWLLNVTGAVSSLWPPDMVCGVAVASSGVRWLSGTAAYADCAAIRAGAGKLGLGICTTNGACRTGATSVPVLESSGSSFLAGELGTDALSFCAPPSFSRSSNSVRLSKTFLNGIVFDAFRSFESNPGAVRFNPGAFEFDDIGRDTAGTWRVAGAGEETITAQLMQVRGHNQRFRLSAR